MSIGARLRERIVMWLGQASIFLADGDEQAEIEELIAALGVGEPPPRTGTRKQQVRMAYADPPYLGCCARYQHEHGTDGRCWDQPETHQRLIGRLEVDFPDGWALSCSTPSLRTLLPFCPEDVRVAAWVKPFAVFKPHVNPAYAWEPVLWRGGRKRGREAATTRDWFSGNITLQRGLTGAKSQAFGFWIFDLLGLEAGDEFVDMFPGSGAVGLAWRRYAERLPLGVGA